jgi:DNA end-binding protein Ku
MRPIWSGAISFGLIHIPVSLYPAVSDKGLDFDLIRKKDLCRIRYARVCRATGEEVPYEDIVKGYQYRKGDYVILEDEDFKKANAKKTQTIEIVSFAQKDEVDMKFLEKPYYVEPGKGAQKAYTLLHEALKRSDRVGIARFVLRTRERMAIIKAEESLLILEQMRFKDEILEATGLNLPKEKTTGKELDMAIKLIDQLTEPFRPDEFHDTYTDELKKVIEAKAKGKVYEVKEEAPAPTAVPDLLGKLRESLAHAQKRRRAPVKEAHPPQ